MVCIVADGCDVDEDGRVSIRGKAEHFTANDRKDVYGTGK